MTILLLGTRRGAFVLRGDPARDRWEVEGPHFRGWEVFDLEADRRRGGDPPALWAAVGSEVYGSVLRRSDDLGRTWHVVEDTPRFAPGSPFRLNQIWRVAPGPAAEPDVLYAGVDEAALFASRDGGRSWSEVDTLTRLPSRPNWQPGRGGLCLHTILVHPRDARRMWVAISAVGVLRTDDGGRSWRLQNRGVPAVRPAEAKDPELFRCPHKLALDPRDPERLYLQDHTGVFASADGGESWTRAQEGLPGAFGFALGASVRGELFVAPLASDEYRAAPGGALTVYRSGDGGASWQPRARGLPREHCHVGVLREGLAVDEGDPATVYLGTTSGQVHVGRGAGQEWRALPYTFPRILSVRVLPAP